ncbi:MAG: hypothetical protein IJF40_01715 [Clostridia bacterium]|nr:hypothetical protein [Clostridia bacterium]
MFAALEIEKSAGVFKRRRLNRYPQVREVRVIGGLPFVVIKTALKRGEINRDAVAFAAGRFAGRMILPNDIQGDEVLRTFDTSRFQKIILFNTAVSLLRDSFSCGERQSLCVVDTKGDLAGRLSHLVPLVSDLRVVSDNTHAYEADIRSAMDEFGAAVRMCDKVNADIVLDFDNVGADGKVTFAFDRGISGNGISLPICYSELVPSGIEPLKFAAALYELCRITSLDELRYRDLYINGEQCSHSRVIEFIKTALRLETIDI